MKNRSVIAVLLLTIVTLGIYGIYWSVVTKIEMNKRGATIPTAWLIIIPIVNIWWMWKYSEGVDKETHGALSTVISFLLLFLLGVIGMMIIQHEFNKGGETSAVPQAAGPAAPVAPIPPEAVTTPVEPAQVAVPEQPSAPTAMDVTPPSVETPQNPPANPTA